MPFFVRSRGNNDTIELYNQSEFQAYQGITIWFNSERGWVVFIYMPKQKNPFCRTINYSIRNKWRTYTYLS